ncbi:MAG: acyl-CoA dehydrogenase family protein [Victivallales bacterium]|nr:acyl-CoA dehydrogenase family protein [Victivallales bacterium]
MEEVVRLRENDYREEGSPKDFAASQTVFREKLETVGALAGGPILKRSEEADRVGVTIQNNEVRTPAATAWNLKDLSDAGLTAITIPHKYGGLNFPVSIYCMMQEIVSRADASLHNLFGLQSIAETINLFGSEEQKAANLPKFASGEYDGAMALTEPNAGSDLQSVQVSAKQDENGVWRLNGVKHFITNGAAQVLLVLARSEEGSKDGRGLSMFLAHPCPEIKYARVEHKLGIHASPTVELHFENAPAELVGERRLGLIRYVMTLMNGARLAISAQAVGLMEATRQAGWLYCDNRTQFGKALSELRPVREMLTRIDALTAASRTLLYETAYWVDVRDAWDKYAIANPDCAEARTNSKAAARIADVLTPLTKAFNTESPTSAPTTASSATAARATCSNAPFNVTTATHAS